MHGQCGLFFSSYAEESQIFPGRFLKISMALFFAAMIAAPFVFDMYIVSILCLINIGVIGAASLNLLTGFCGQISLGHGAFFGVGAYTAGVCTAHGLPFPPALLCAGLVTAVVGMVFGLPSLRLKGIYLAISTLAAQLILEYVFLHWESVTGGSNGMAVDPPSLFGFAFDTDERMFYLTFVIACLCVLAVKNITRTRVPARHR